MVAVVGMVAACGDKPHASKEAASGFMTAWVYGDGARMFAIHEESGPGGSWCGSAQFVRSLERARSVISPERCAEAVALTEDERAEEAGEEAVLLAHQLRLVCKDERAGCQEWSRRVFETALDGCARPTGFVVQQVQGDAARATAYVDVEGGAGGKRKLDLTWDGGAWRVVTPLMELCK
jgi:hypothetical protein